MTVNKERVKLLVDALRSGEFEQGQQMLRARDDTYCCLGVACEVARLNGIGIEWMPIGACGCGYCFDCRWSFDGSDEALGANVASWYDFGEDGFFANDPPIGISEVGNVVTAVHANDVLGWNFLQIADAIEAKYLTVDPA